MTLNRIDEHKNLNGVAVYIAGDDRGEGVIEATTGPITPGMAVERGTAAGELAPAATGATASGWLTDNINPSRAARTEEDLAEGEFQTLRTPYVDGDRAVYYRNNGDKFMGLVTSGQNLAKDAILSVVDGKFVAVGAGIGIARLIQEGGTGGALGADTHLLVRWGVN